MPSASVSRAIPASQHDVWAVLSDIANARRWNDAWSKIEITSRQTHGPGTEFRAQTESGAAYTFVITDWVAPELITFVPVREEEEPQYTITLESQTFRLRPLSETETMVELSARARARGVRGRFTAMFFWPGYQRHGLEQALDALAAIFARGETDGGKEEGEVESPAE